MNRQDKIIAGLLMCLICAGTFSLYQGIMLAQMQQELNDTNGRLKLVDTWGAEITMLWSRNGVVLSEETHHNVITDAARSALRGHLADSALDVWEYIAIGTSTGGGVGSTTLENEFARYAAVYATVGSYNFTLTLTFAAGNFSGQTITEYGVFNDPTTGTLLSYDDSFSRGPLLADDTLQVTANFYFA